MQANDWITLAATIVAAASFVWGVFSWRASYLGQKKIELAEQVYEISLNCVDHVRAIRSPMSYVGEGSTRQRSDNESAGESELYDRAYVALERMEGRKEDFNKLFSLMPRFEFYFGEIATKPIRDIQEILQEIRSASFRLRHYWIQQGRQFASGEEFQDHLTQMHAAEAVFWDGYNGDDPINPRLELAASQVKETCKRAIDPRVNLWWMLKRGLVRIEDFLRIPSDIR